MSLQLLTVEPRNYHSWVIAVYKRGFVHMCGDPQREIGRKGGLIEGWADRKGVSLSMHNVILPHWSFSLICFSV